MGWQDIKAAPKDGRRVLILRAAAKPMTTPIRNRVVIAKWRDRWQMESSTGDKNHTQVNASMWMPLPAPPCTETASEDERNEREIQDRIAAAVSNAMEKCAQLAERYPANVLQFWDRPGGPPGNGYRPATGSDIAAAIREQICARTETAQQQPAPSETQRERNHDKRVS